MPKKPYITQLRDTVEEKEARILELEAQLQAIASYLALPKFSQETWVSKYDILRMIGKY